MKQAALLAVVAAVAGCVSNVPSPRQEVAVVPTGYRQNFFMWELRIPPDFALTPRLIDGQEYWCSAPAPVLFHDGPIRQTLPACFADRDGRQRFTSMDGREVNVPYVIEPRR